MADALSFIPTNVLHKLYEKRKNAALEHGRKKINVELKKEAEYFGDIVIVPYMDNYDLVVLKTVAICEYGARFLTAKYIIKCDDDTFVRVGAVIKEAKKVDGDRSLYVGNMNYYHKPLRNDKWAITYEVCESVNPLQVDEGVVESALIEITRDYKLQVQEEIRDKISVVEAELLRESEKSTSTFSRIEKYREARRELDQKLDTLYQRKIAEALDDHLIAVQRDHELKSQIEERKIKSDAAHEEAKRREKSLQEERLRQERAKAEAETKCRAGVAKVVTLEAERRAGEQAAEKKAAQDFWSNEHLQDSSSCTLIAEKFALNFPEILAGHGFSRLLTKRRAEVAKVVTLEAERRAGEQAAEKKAAQDFWSNEHLQDSSSCTLIAEKFALNFPEILAGHGFSRLLLAGILLDTGDLTNPRCTVKDRYMATLLINGAGRFGSSGLFQILRYKMQDVSNLNIVYILRKDFKKWTRVGPGLHLFSGFVL